LRCELGLAEPLPRPELAHADSMAEPLIGQLGTREILLVLLVQSIRNHEVPGITRKLRCRNVSNRVDQGARKVRPRPSSVACSVTWERSAISIFIELRFLRRPRFTAASDEGLAPSVDQCIRRCSILQSFRHASGGGRSMDALDPNVIQAIAAGLQDG